jgi:hypothetical protein
LIGAIIRIGNNLAIFGSIARTIKALIVRVLIAHQKIRFSKYLVPDFE